MLDIGWTELLVIAIVLIVVVGPKDLPPMLRAFGKMTANLRRMAGEFRSQFDEALRDADLDDVRKTIADAQSLNPANSLRDALNPIRQMGEELKSDLRKVTTPPVTAAEMPSVVSDTPAAPASVSPSPAVPVAAVQLEVVPAVASAPAEPVAAKPRAARKPRTPAAAKAEEGASAAKPRKRTAKAESVEGQPVKKAAPRKKKTSETGKDEA